MHAWTKLTIIILFLQFLSQIPQQHLVGIHRLCVQACSRQTTQLKQYYFLKAVGTNKVYWSNWKVAKVVLPWQYICFCQELQQNKNVYWFIFCISKDFFFYDTTNLIKDKCNCFLLLEKKNRLTLTCHEITLPSSENHWDALEVKIYSRTTAQTTSQKVQEKLCTVPIFRNGPSGNTTPP